MSQPSKAGPVFLAVFGTPFLCFGALGVFAFLTSSPAISRSGHPLVGACFSAVFALIGGGFILAAVFGYRSLKQEATLKEASPNMPWLWRTDWASSRAQSLNRNKTVVWWIGTILVSMVTVPVAIVGLPGLLRNRDPNALLVIGFLSFPLILLVGALRSTIRRLRYGEAYLEFNSLPFVPGRHMSGQIQLGSKTAARHGIRVRLSCVRRFVSGSGDEQNQSEVMFWQDEKNISEHELMVGPLGTSIPVDFAIPEDAFETNHDQANDKVLWLLHAQAEVAGLDYADDFEVPVFRLDRQATASNQVAPSGNSATGLQTIFRTAAVSTAPSFFSDSSEVVPPPNPKVKVATTNEGSTEFYYPAFRNKGQGLFLLFFTAIWTTVVVVLWRSTAPWFFALIFGFFDLLLVYGCFQIMLVSTRIIVGQGKIVSCRERLGRRTSWEVPFSDIETILPSVGLHQGTRTTNASYLIRLHTKSGRHLIVVDSIAERSEARWVVAEIERLAGMKRDTHVAIQDRFGNSYGLPPQRGDRVGRDVAGKRGIVGRMGQGVGVFMFLLWLGFVLRIGWGSWRDKPVPRTPVERSSSLRPANAPRVIYAALTDQDIDRLKALPPQAQAEELLERAIQHDRRSLALFEESIGTKEWLGRIRLTDRMKQLEQRSEFSSDLRVRYANADLNLSMDGWPKSAQSADLLIERAASDPHYRAAALYFMGMLAGRGVAYDRIYPVLLDYAKHNPDATVRLWAIEGMRYLGTDEALDQLFESFVHDPSDQVRERAGANLSCCGNFTRRQRMRAVPKLISLVASPTTAPQLRSWGFLALREITDQNLPNDASTWQGWYQEHGEETLAQFERQGWWWIRGDE